MSMPRLFPLSALRLCTYPTLKPYTRPDHTFISILAVQNKLAISSNNFIQYSSYSTLNSASTSSSSSSHSSFTRSYYHSRYEEQYSNGYNYYYQRFRSFPKSLKPPWTLYLLTLGPAALTLSGYHLFLSERSRDTAFLYNLITLPSTDSAPASAIVKKRNHEEERLQEEENDEQGNGTVVPPVEPVVTLLENPIHSVLHVLVWTIRSLLKAAVILSRSVWLFALVAPLVLCFPIWYYTTGWKISTYPVPGTSVPENWWWLWYLVWTVESAGPTFIKLGQWASSRNDIFPSYVCEVLSKLQSRVEAHSFSATRYTIKSELGFEIEELFSSFDPEPIGVGAIAQVYKGVLRPSPGNTRPNQPVAVKVLHPFVTTLIHTDLTILTILASIINSISTFEYLSFPDQVEVFGTMMKSQLDLRTEATNLEILGQNFRHRKGCGVPGVLWPCVGRRVLVEELKEGIEMGKVLNLLAPSPPHGTELGKRIAGTGLDAFLRMLVIDNFVHTDLHPGNMILSFCEPSPSLPFYLKIYYYFFPPTYTPPTPFVDRATLQRLNDSTPEAFQLETSRMLRAGYKPYITFLDAGLVSSLSPHNLKNFLDLFRAIAYFESRKVGYLLVARSRYPEKVIDRQGFELGIAHIVDTVQRNTLRLDVIQLSDVLSQVLHLVRQHHVTLEGEFVNMVIGCLLLEGVGRKLDPELDLLRVGKGVLDEMQMSGHGFGLDEGEWRGRWDVLKVQWMLWIREIGMWVKDKIVWRSSKE